MSHTLAIEDVTWLCIIYGHLALYVHTGFTFFGAFQFKKEKVHLVQKVRKMQVELSRAELNWVELSQAESSWVKLSQAESSWLKLSQAESSWVKLKLRQAELKDYRYFNLSTL